MITKANSTEKSMCFNPEAAYGNGTSVRDKISSRIDSLKVLIIDGEGEPGNITVNIDKKEFFYGEHGDDPLNFAFDTDWISTWDNSKYEDLQLAMIYGCNSGQTETHINMETLLMPL